MNALRNDLQGRLDQIKNRAKESSDRLDDAANDLRSRLLAYFAADDWRGGKAFYDLILSLPMQDSSRSDCTAKLSANFRGRVYLPEAGCSRTAHDRAAFCTDHKSLGHIRESLAGLESRESRLRETLDDRREAYSGLKTRYDEAKRIFTRLSGGLSLDNADRGDWEGFGAGKILRYLCMPGERKLFDYLRQGREEEGFSLLELPRRTRLPKPLTGRPKRLTTISIAAN